MYITVETYAQDIIPNECTTGSVKQPDGSIVEMPNPLVYFAIFKTIDLKFIKLDEKYYTD